MKAKTYRKLAKKGQDLTTETASATLAETVLATALRRSSLAVEEPEHAAGQVVKGIATELPTLRAVAVVEAASGATLAAYSSTTSLHLETAAAYSAEVVKQKQKALAALQLTDEKIEDILMTLSTQLHLIKLSADGRKLIYLVVDAHDTNLAVAREVLCSSVATLV